jgi:energy-coupling factor transport system permease protein
VRSLVRLIPRAFYQVAVVISIAITYVPTTLRQLQQIREAQAIRGHRTRGLRDWIPLFMPLLVGGLERALQLAEAMVARGFASSGEKSHDTLTRLVIAQGLIALFIGWLLRLVWDQNAMGLALMVAGLGLMIAALWVVGRRVPHTNYRPEAWTSRDWIVVLGAAMAIAPFLLPLPGLNRDTIFYYPYPELTLPGFDPIIGVAILGLLAPALTIQAHSVASNRVHTDIMPRSKAEG